RLAYEIQSHEHVLLSGGWSYEVGPLLDSLLRLGKDSESLVKESDEDEEVPVYSALDMVLWNAGNEPIRKEDYDAPITISFNTARILLCDVFTTNPPGLKATPKMVSPHRIELPRLLLNSRYTIGLTFWLADSLEEPTVDARIVGVPRIVQREYRFDPPYLFWLGAGSIVLFAVSNVWLLVGGLAHARLDSFPSGTPFGIVLETVLGLFLLCTTALAVLLAVRRYMKWHG
ncbi:MAG TPA: hypothetical protein VF116_08760, partial [Ktedonobacterales bacterium]